MLLCPLCTAKCLQMAFAMSSGVVAHFVAFDALQSIGTQPMPRVAAHMPTCSWQGCPPVCQQVTWRASQFSSMPQPVSITMAPGMQDLCCT